MQKSIQKLAVAFSFCALFFAFPFLMSTAQPAMQVVETVTCDAPGVSVVNQGDSFVTFSVSLPAGTCEYKYVRTNDNTTSGTITTTNSTVTISGLAPGVYRFYFKSLCSQNEGSDYVISELIFG